MKRLFLIGALTLAASVTPAFAQLLPRAVSVDARAEVAAALYAASATQAAAERSANAQLRAAQAEIARLQSEGASTRTELAAAQEAYVAELAQRDRGYEQEIAALRTAVQEIAASPEGAAALARFNAGDEIGALAVLDQLRAARDRARQVRANVESAAEGRDITALALEARSRGRIDTLAVIARFEDVTRLDPGVFWDWAALSRLLLEAGRLPESRAAAQRALELAQNKQDTSIALTALADATAAVGNLEEATALHTRALAIDRENYVLSPVPVSRRNLSVSLSRLAETTLALGDAEGAIPLYAEAALYDLQAYEETSQLWAAQDMCVDYNNLSDAFVASGDLNSARTYLEIAFPLCERIANHTGSVEDAVQLGFARWRRANIRAVQGDLGFARSEFRALSQLADGVLSADPTNALIAMQVQRLNLGLADLEMLSGNSEVARVRLQSFVASLQQYENQAGFATIAANLVWLAQVRLSVLPNSQVTWSDLEQRFRPSIAMAHLSALDWSFINMARAGRTLEPTARPTGTKTRSGNG